MPRADLIVYNIGELVTFHKGPLPGRRARDPGEAGIVRGAAVAFRDGRIVAVGRDPDVRGSYTLAFLVVLSTWLLAGLLFTLAKPPNR